MLTPDKFLLTANQRFADNEFQRIREGSFRAFAADIAATFVAQAAVNVPDYEPGRYYAAGFLIRHSFGSATPVFLSAAEDGFLPAPTAAAGDDSWRAALSPASGPVLSQVGTVTALRHAQNFWVPGRLYILTNRTDHAGHALPTVYVRALSASQLEPEGFIIDDSALSPVSVPVSYDLAIDETAPVAAGAGNGYSKDEVDALLVNKGAADVQAQHTQQLNKITPLVPTKATAANQFATLADIGQVTFVDVPLALTSGSYAIPADCAGKRFIISTGTANTFLNLRALNNDSVGKVFAVTISNGVRQQLKALAFGSYVTGDYIELGETALLLVGKQAAGPGFYYYAFKIGTQAAVKSVNGVLPDAAGNVVIAAGGNGYSDAQAAAAALASLVAGNSQHQGVQVSDVNGVPKLTVAGAVTDIVRLRMPASGAGNLAEGQDFRDSDAGGSYQLTATANVARFAIINPAGPTTLFDGKATDYPAGGVPLVGGMWFTYQIVSVDVTQPVFLELSLVH